MEILHIDTGLEMPSFGLISECCGCITPHGKTFCGQFFITDFFCTFKSDSRGHTLGLPLPSHQAG